MFDDQPPPPGPGSPPPAPGPPWGPPPQWNQGGWSPQPVDERTWYERLRGRITPAQVKLVGLILVLAASTIAYRLVYLTGVHRTAALYVGVPTVLAIGLALLPRSRSATAMLLKGTTLAIVMAAVILPEGALCLLFVLPLTGLISALVGGAIDLGRRRGYQDRHSLMVVSLPLVLMSLEGVAASPFDHDDAAVATISVDATPAQVEAALAQPPRFDRDLPPFLTLGFNRPRHARGEGLDLGDTRVITFSGGSHDDHPMGLGDLVNGHGETEDHQHSASRDGGSTMVLTVAEHRPGRVVFEVESDDTMLARWATVGRAVVTWTATADGRTRVTWRLEFERLLHPAVYFAPLQRYGLGLAAEHLLQVVVVDGLDGADQQP